MLNWQYQFILEIISLIINKLYFMEQRLFKEIMAVIIIKVMALIFIKYMWFSNPQSKTLNPDKIYSHLVKNNS